MANSVMKQILLDGPRNAVVKITGVLDTSDVSMTPAVDLSDFTNNDKGQAALTGFRVDRMEYSISDQLEIQLCWDGVNPQQITPIAGRGRIDAWHYGGWLPNKSNAGYDGTINLYTTGFASGRQNFSILLELVKLYS